MVAAQVPLLEPGVGQQQTCSDPVVAGACQLTSCRLGGIGNPSPGYGDFGPLSASVGSTTVDVPYHDLGYPTVGFPASVSLKTGGTMTFHGGDGNVPDFDVTATIPGLGVITSPITTIDTSQDLAIAWMPIEIGQIGLAFEGGSHNVGGVAVSIACTFDGTAGTGVVPQALLASFAQMSGANPTYGNLSSRLETSTVIDGLTITTQSYQSSGSDGEFTVTFE